MAAIRVGVLRGGPSNEYDISIRTGASVLTHMPRKYRAHDVLLSKDHQWHLDGVPMPASRVFDAVDVIFNALHGVYGEDGKVQHLFASHGVRYTGAGPYASAIALNKILSKEVVARAGIRTAPWVVGDVSRHTPDMVLRQAIQKLSPPWVVKDPIGGSSIGVFVIRSRDELLHCLERMFLSGTRKVLIEQYVMGREATCGILDHFRGEKRYTLPVVEIIPHSDRTFFDYTCKYDGSTREMCPARFTQEEKRAIEDMAKRAYGALDLSQYARLDFMLTKHGPYFLEANTLPALSPESSFPASVGAVGASYSELLDHLITNALRFAPSS